MQDSQAYLFLMCCHLVFNNYLFVCVPLPSVFNWDYLQEHMESYHDGRLLDYSQFGFPLGLKDRHLVTSNAKENHHSALAYAADIDAFFQKELKENALFGPFDEEPHPTFTWSPLMTCPKGVGRRVILDLSYGEQSVSVHTDRDVYDEIPFKLTLPSLDSLLPTLQCLGSNAQISTVDISCAFRNVPVDPGDAIHLGMKWRD